MDGQPTQPSGAASFGGPAKFQAAREILASAGSPDELHRGIVLMDEASAEGCADATELRSVFEAMGVARPQSWDRAFDCLQLAAEQGSAKAGQQLLLLADPDITWEKLSTASNTEWGQVRSAISLERLLVHGERSHLCENPRIRVIDKFATPAECRWLMERARPRLARATVLKKTGDHGVAEGRSNRATVFYVVDMDLVLEMIRARISAATKVPVPLFEPTQVFHYSVGQEFRPHHDFIDPSSGAYRQQVLSGQRIATFVIYLNEDFEGGETDFQAVGIRYRGRTGDAIFWANLDTRNQPDPLTIHAGLPPTVGEKWILSQWIRDRVPGAPADDR